jgi:hypothetical protein
MKLRSDVEFRHICVDENPARHIRKGYRRNEKLVLTLIHIDIDTQLKTSGRRSIAGER